MLNYYVLMIFEFIPPCLPGHGSPSVSTNNYKQDEYAETFHDSVQRCPYLTGMIHVHATDGLQAIGFPPESWHILVASVVSSICTDAGNTRYPGEATDESKS